MSFETQLEFEKVYCDTSSWQNLFSTYRGYKLVSVGLFLNEESKLLTFEYENNKSSLNRNNLPFAVIRTRRNEIPETAIVNKFLYKPDYDEMYTIGEHAYVLRKLGEVEPGGESVQIPVLVPIKEEDEINYGEHRDREYVWKKPIEILSEIVMDNIQDGISGRQRRQVVGDMVTTMLNHYTML